MSDRPRRAIKPPSGLREYVVATELGDDDATDASGHSDPKEENPEDSSFGFRCKTCNDNCRNRSEFLLHLKKHRGKENFLCEDCGKSLSSFQAFTEHKNIHSNVKPHKCKTCGHSSRQLSVHLRHLLTHEKNPSQVFKCTICPKSFKRKEYLKQHTRKHVGEKPYQCSHCEKAFSAKTELNRHLISHSSSKPFSCEKCHKRFKLKHNLTTHFKAHLGKQTWRCSLCSCSFHQHSLLEAHKKSHREVVQHLELVKTDRRSLSITSFPLDKRKVQHYQKVDLPKRLDLNDLLNAYNSKVALGLNDTLIPFSVIANSFGTGNYIKMKIVDQVGETYGRGRRQFSPVRGVTEAVVVEGGVEDEEEVGEDVEEDNQPRNHPFEGKSKPDVFSKESQAPLVTHCREFEKAFGDNVIDQAKLSWLQELVTLLKNANYPLDTVVFQHLCKAQSKLQEIFHNLTELDKGKKGPSIALHAPSCELCFSAPDEDFTGDSNRPQTNVNADVLEDTCCPARKLRRAREREGKDRQKEFYECYESLSKCLLNHFKVVLDLA